MDETINSVLSLLQTAVNTKTGTAIFAAVLATLVIVLKKVPAIATYEETHPKMQHAAMLFLAVVPAVVITLSTTASWYDALLTAINAGFAATGVIAVNEKVVTPTLKAAFKR